MATTEQIKSLTRSHLSSNAEQFFASVLQIAAYETCQGQDMIVNEIKEMMDRVRE